MFNIPPALSKTIAIFVAVTRNTLRTHDFDFFSKNHMAHTSFPRLKKTLLSLLLGIALPALLNSCDKSAHLAFKKGDLEYNTKQVTADQAQKVGAAMLSDSMFSDKRVSSAKLEKPDSVFLLTIVFNRSKVDDDIKDAMRELAFRYSEDTLNAAPLDIVLADSAWTPIDTETYRSLGKHLDVDGSKIFYTDAAGLEVATKFVNYKQPSGFFKADTKVIRLDKNAQGYLFELYRYQTPRSEAQQEMFREMASDWSTEVFGGIPVTFELCDLTMKPFLVIAPKAGRS